MLAHTALLSLTGIMSSAAWAASCGISGSSASTPVNYDPFNPAGLGTTTVTLSLTRQNPPGGGFTRSVFFYLQSPTPSANGTEIRAVSATGSVKIFGSGLNVFYDYGGIGPNLNISPPASTNRYLQIDFTGNNAASDTVQVIFTIQLPANLDAVAGSSLGFDLHFRCEASSKIDETGSIGNAISFPVRVLSALQASFAGPALDFGEVGDRTDAEVIASPIIKTGYIRVASSGVFNVTMASTNGYKLTFPSGDLSQASQTLGYQVKFLGETRSPFAANLISKPCGRAGVPLASGQSLPIEVRLLNGGSNRTPAPNYSDSLVVTLSPQITPSAASSCSGL